jgi:hypothetical protein
VNSDAEWPPLARRARPGDLAADAASSPAHLAGLEARDFDLGPDATECLAQLEIHHVVDVLAAPYRRGRAVPLGLEGLVSEPIVQGASGRVPDHAVRLADLLEQDLGPRVPRVHVRRVASGEAAVGLADLNRRALP